MENSPQYPWIYGYFYSVLIDVRTANADTIKAEHHRCRADDYIAIITAARPPRRLKIDYRQHRHLNKPRITNLRVASPDRIHRLIRLNSIGSISSRFVVEQLVQQIFSKSIQWSLSLMDDFEVFVLQRLRDEIWYGK